MSLRWPQPFFHSLTQLDRHYWLTHASSGKCFALYSAILGKQSPIISSVNSIEDTILNSISHSRDDIRSSELKSLQFTIWWLRRPTELSHCRPSWLLSVFTNVHYSEESSRSSQFWHLTWPANDISYFILHILTAFFLFSFRGTLWTIIVILHNLHGLGLCYRFPHHCHNLVIALTAVRQANFRYLPSLQFSPVVNQLCLHHCKTKVFHSSLFFCKQFTFNMKSGLYSCIIELNCNVKLSVLGLSYSISWLVSYFSEQSQ